MGKPKTSSFEFEFLEFFKSPKTQINEPKTEQLNAHQQPVPFQNLKKD